jgi:predicted RNA-binding Zn-ribbon protein involved in translation (DUF1610 family)
MGVVGFGEYVKSSAATLRVVGKCVACNRPVSAHSESTRVACPDCGDTVACERIVGVVVGMTCDVRCEGAYGPSCQCACGGENHSARWSEKREMLESELSAYSADQERRAEAGEKRRQGVRDRKRREFDAWAGGDVTVARLAVYEGDDTFLGDLAHKVRRYEVLTERQVAAAARTFDRIGERECRDAERKANSTPVPEGKVTITGTVITVRVDDNPYTYGGAVYKMLVEDGRGFRVWGTAPSQLKQAAGGLSELKGRTVEFVATCTRSNDDESFGFFSRPSKPRLMEAVS